MAIVMVWVKFGRFTLGEMKVKCVRACSACVSVNAEFWILARLNFLQMGSVWAGPMGSTLERKV